MDFQPRTFHLDPAWRCKQNIQVYGVVRQSGRGIPKCILQKEVTRKADIEQARGTLKAAELVGDAKCKGLLAISLYDSKPFYMMTMACEKVEWRLKKRKLWDKEQMKMVSKPFYRLNVVDEYNNHMNNVDVADQLRGSYRFDHWMRKRKWWWSMFFWCFQMLMTNAYVTYKKYLLIHDRKPISHYEFRKAIAMAWTNPKENWPDDGDRKKQRRDEDEVRPRRRRTGTGTGSNADQSTESKRSVAFTDATLDPRQGLLKKRLEVGGHWPKAISPHKKDVSCQMHKWGRATKVRAKLLHCMKCNATLCIDCF